MFAPGNRLDDDAANEVLGAIAVLGVVAVLDAVKVLGVVPSTSKFY